MLGSAEAFATAADADDDHAWQIGPLEGLDLRGRPMRLAIERDARRGGASPASPLAIIGASRRLVHPLPRRPPPDQVLSTDDAVEGTDDAPT